MAPQRIHDSDTQNGKGSTEFIATRINFEVMVELRECSWSANRRKHEFETI